MFAAIDREERSILEARVRYEGCLSHEAIEQCSRRKTRTVGEASRIPGVTPAAIAIISAHVARAGRSGGPPPA
jgi:tRNA uridine 5-carboxymethylaminomethyl modification enzyme